MDIITDISFFFVKKIDISNLFIIDSPCNELGNLIKVSRDYQNYNIPPNLIEIQDPANTPINPQDFCVGYISFNFINLLISIPLYKYNPSTIDETENGQIFQERTFYSTINGNKSRVYFGNGAINEILKNKKYTIIIPDSFSIKDSNDSNDSNNLDLIIPCIYSIFDLSGIQNKIPSYSIFINHLFGILSKDISHLINRYIIDPSSNALNNLDVDISFDQIRIEYKNDEKHIFNKAWSGYIIEYKSLIPYCLSLYNKKKLIKKLNINWKKKIKKSPNKRAILNIINSFFFKNNFISGDDGIQNFLITYNNFKIADEEAYEFYSRAGYFIIISYLLFTFLKTYESISDINLDFLDDFFEELLDTYYDLSDPNNGMVLISKKKLKLLLFKIIYIFGKIVCLFLENLGYKDSVEYQNLCFSLTSNYNNFKQSLKSTSINSNSEIDQTGGGIKESKIKSEDNINDFIKKTGDLFHILETADLNKKEKTRGVALPLNP